MIPLYTTQKHEERYECQISLASALQELGTLNTLLEYLVPIGSSSTKISAVLFFSLFSQHKIHSPILSNSFLVANTDFVFSPQSSRLQVTHCPILQKSMETNGFSLTCPKTEDLMILSKENDKIEFLNVNNKLYPIYRNNALTRTLGQLSRLKDDINRSMSYLQALVPNMTITTKAPSNFYSYLEMIRKLFNMPILESPTIEQKDQYITALTSFYENKAVSSNQLLLSYGINKIFKQYVNNFMDLLRFFEHTELLKDFSNMNRFLKQSLPLFSVTEGVLTYIISEDKYSHKEIYFLSCPNINAQISEFQYFTGTENKGIFFFDKKVYNSFDLTISIDKIPYREIEYIDFVNDIYAVFLKTKTIIFCYSPTLILIDNELLRCHNSPLTLGIFENISIPKIQKRYTYMDFRLNFLNVTHERQLSSNQSYSKLIYDNITAIILGTLAFILKIIITIILFFLCCRKKENFISNYLRKRAQSKLNSIARDTIELQPL